MVYEEIYIDTTSKYIEFNHGTHFLALPWEKNEQCRKSVEKNIQMGFSQNKKKFFFEQFYSATIHSRTMIQVSLDSPKNK